MRSLYSNLVTIVSIHVSIIRLIINLLFFFRAELWFDPSRLFGSAPLLLRYRIIETSFHGMLSFSLSQRLNDSRADLNKYEKEHKTKKKGGKSGIRQHEARESSRSEWCGTYSSFGICIHRSCRGLHGCVIANCRIQNIFIIKLIILITG